MFRRQILEDSFLGLEALAPSLVQLLALAEWIHPCSTTDDGREGRLIGEV